MRPCERAVGQSGHKNSLLTGKTSNRTRLTESSDLLEPAGGEGKEDKKIPKFNQRHPAGH